MDVGDLKQLCIDLSNAAMGFFDKLDERGAEVPLEDTIALFQLKDMIDITQKLRDYYLVRSTTRLLGLGVSPETLLKGRRAR